MIKQLKIRRYLLISILLISYVLVYYIISIYIPDVNAIMLSTCFVLSLLYFSYKRLIISLERNYLLTNTTYMQTQYLLYLYNKIDFRRPLPKTRGFASSPDFLTVIHDIIKEIEPRYIIECGSGLSTLIIGYCIEGGNSKLISLEQNKEEIKKTKSMIHNHSLVFDHEMVYAPLIPHKDSFWYDLSNLDIPNELDLIIIDGPYEHDKHGQFRKHAFDIFKKHITENSVILVDDAFRDRSFIDQWKKEFDINIDYLNTEKGTAIIKMN